MNGYHIYFQQDKEIDFIDISSQFASILCWKKYFGSIRLYCNTKFLETITKYRLDTLYDEINVTCLDNVPNKKVIKKYWSYPKIYAINEIAKTDNKFCVIDTDLWIKNKISWNEDLDFVGFHFESFDLNNKNNPYLHPSKFIDNVNEQEWDMNAINCSFMYFNNQKLISEWFDYVNNVIDLNKKSYIPKIHKRDSYTLFIEQRAIIYLCKKLNLNYGTLIDNVFHAGLKTLTTLGKPAYVDTWVPSLDFSLEPQKYIVHIWGLKRFYNLIDLRINLLEQIYRDIFEHFGNLEITYPEIYSDRMKEYVKKSLVTSFKRIMQEKI